jgi:predicted XRE-type DNA-binding protein
MSKKGYEVGGRNVFKDIGVPNAEEHLVKAQLVYKIDTIMKKRRMKQTEAAALFGVRQPDISKMLLAFVCTIPRLPRAARRYRCTCATRKSRP